MTGSSAPPLLLAAQHGADRMRDVARAAAAKEKVWTLDHRARVEAIAHDRLEELLRRKL